MAADNLHKIALLGNPNLGKTTLFNTLCGLRQKTGNYPGVTVDKKKGRFTHNKIKFELTDLPGINSLFPKSKDEELVVDYLLNTDKDKLPEKLIVMASAINLKRSLYLVDQIRDLNIPTILVVNMIDVAAKRGISIDTEVLSKEFGIPVVAISAKKGKGIEALKDALINPTSVLSRSIHYLEPANISFLEEKNATYSAPKYATFLRLVKGDIVGLDSAEQKKWKTNESILRYKFLGEIESKVLSQDKSKATDFTTRADKLLVHPIFGYVIFAAILLLIFQSIFWLASYPMDWIDNSFSWMSEAAAANLPKGYFSDLLAEGIIPGVGGVVIFVPQIAILFFLFSILEESGYMQRIVYLMDRFMQKFGMSGKSVVPMISGLACAIPAIMAARTIENNKERLITILITPLLTCSARIPVYVVIIALVIPDDAMVGIFNAQGLALMGMYLLGVILSLICAIVFKWILKQDYKSTLIIDMPHYLMPDFKNVFISVWNNAKAFVWNAGKIILATSIILFVLATNGGESFKNAQENVVANHPELNQEEQEALISSVELESSYLGTIGKSIEPAIQPLGYDWKIGISLITSLAAREVFVGTMSTIYSINSEEEMTIRDRLKSQKKADGSLVFGFATSISLLLFYAFALQCFSTVAVTYKETKSIKWTTIQFVYMTALAYFSALIAYQILS
ncbi:MAG: ferrous iron transport protein B [Crocinitomicaceae bacterium]